MCWVKVLMNWSMDLEYSLELWIQCILPRQKPNPGFLCINNLHLQVINWWQFSNKATQYHIKMAMNKLTTL